MQEWSRRTKINKSNNKNHQQREYAYDDSSISFEHHIRRTKRKHKDDATSDQSRSSDKTSTAKRKNSKAGKRTTPNKPETKETGNKTRTLGISGKRDKKQRKKGTIKPRGRHSNSDSDNTQPGNQNIVRHHENITSSEESSIRGKRPNWRWKRRIETTTTDKENKDKQLNKKEQQGKEQHDQTDNETTPTQMTQEHVQGTQMNHMTQRQHKAIMIERARARKVRNQIGAQQQIAQENDTNTTVPRTAIPTEIGEEARKTTSDTWQMIVQQYRVKSITQATEIES
jgi:hypothetical protein